MKTTPRRRDCSKPRAPGFDVSDQRALEPVTQDALLGGRLTLCQPAVGYRVAIDPVLLAAAVPAELRGRAADLGCGVGAASLCLASRLPQIEIVGIERHPAMAALARANAAANGLEPRFSVQTADILALSPDCAAESFDAVIANPPYLEAQRANPTAAPGKAAATIEDRAGLADWIGVALTLARRKGVLVFIQRADRLDALLAALRDRAGEIVVFPLWPKAGMPAKRVIIRARKGVRSPLTLAAGLVLHGEDGRYTAAAEAVLRDGAGLDLT